MRIRAVVPHYGSDVRSGSLMWKKRCADYVLHEDRLMHQSTYNDKLECIFPAWNIYIVPSFDKAHACVIDELEYLFTDHLLPCGVLFSFSPLRRGIATGSNRKGDADKISRMGEKTYCVAMKNWKFGRLICTLFYQKRYQLLK